MTKSEKIERVKTQINKTLDPKKIRKLRESIDKIRACDCGGWITSNEHHYDWCASHKVYSYNDYYFPDGCF